MKSAKGGCLSMFQDIERKFNKLHAEGSLDGYRSKLCISPLSWEEVPLKKLAKKITEKNLNSSVTTVLSNTALHGVIRQVDYFEKDIANSENIDTYFVVREKDFVYNPRISSAAPFGPIHPNELGICGIVSPLYTVFRLNSSNILEYQYMKFYFDSSQWHKFMYTVANYGARYDRMNITDKDFFTLTIPLPSEGEQRKIVEILNHCNKVIELKQRLIDEERNRKKWLMQNLFNPSSGIRLPGFSGDWKERYLSHVGKFFKGSGISNEDCKTGDSPCIKYGDIYMSYNEFFTSPVSYTEEKITAVTPKAIEGALLFTASGEDRLEIGKCTAYLGHNQLAVGGDIVVLHPDCSKYNSMFLAYQQYSESLIKQKARLAQGYSIVHLYTAQVRALKIMIPPTIEEQTAIANSLFAIDQNISLLEQELNQWQQKKKALMQLLLTGLVRVRA
jgi:type I restriction enzyme S subunit